MNPIHNKGKSGETLQNDLDHIGQAYGQLEQTEPPDLVDQAILNRAHRAVEKKPHWMKFGWLHGLTTVAIFGLAISLVLNRPEHTPAMNDEADIHSGVQALQEAEPVAVGTLDKREVDSSILREQEASANRAEHMAAAPATDAEKAIKPSEFRITAKRSLSGDRSSAGGDETGATYGESVGGESVGRQRSDAPIAPTAAAEALEPLVEELNDADRDIEEQLKTILQLKKSGDETWITELEKFRLDYPDYPLPAELKP